MTYLRSVRDMLPYVPDAQKRVPPQGYRKTNTRSRAWVGRERLRRAAPPCLAQKTREIFLFPTSGTFIEAKFAFAEIEFVGVHTAPPIIAHLVRHDRMQHFMIQDVLEEPKRHEALIEPGIDTNDAIFFLDGPENKIFFRTFPAFTAPNHFVTAKTVTEMTRV